ncbi:MAG: ABC transporter permease [Gammaproteobacteria bacterium]|nr:ABC transporter permease [Gammaproteobacteria bacterium]
MNSLWLSQCWALMRSRVLEMLRDRATLMWNLVFPVFLIVSFAFAFDGQRARFTIVAPQQFDLMTGGWYEFLHNSLIRVDWQDEPLESLDKLAKHQVDMIVDPLGNAYWINQNSANAYLLEKVLLQIMGPNQGLVRHRLEGEPIRYVDWVFPGIIGLNLMFSALWGVGYALVRYRRNGVLKRLQATGTSASVFMFAQLGARLGLLLVMVTVLFIGLDWVFEFPVVGSFGTLLLVYLAGACAMLALGLLLAASTQSEELASGLINFISWPLVLLSEIWFSLEGAHPLVAGLKQASPLWHMIDAARAVMYDAATLTDVLPQLGYVIGFAVVVMALGAKLFKWR